MAITRLWFFTLRPSVSPADPAFTSLWADVLELCASYTPSPGPSSSHGHVAALSQPCPRRPHHFLFRSVSSSSVSPSPSEEGDHRDGDPAVFVLISTYPSLALCAQADAAYARRLRPRVLARVRHRALRQIDMEDAEAVPALLVLSRRRPAAAAAAGDAADAGDERDGRSSAPDPDAPAAAVVAVVISSRDPLREGVVGSPSGGAAGAGGTPGARAPVAPPGEEISGADVFEPPPPPAPPAAPAAPAAGDREGRKEEAEERQQEEGEEEEEEEEDVFAEQRGEGKRWVRISRVAGAGGGDADVEVFRLRELLSR